MKELITNIMNLQNLRSTSGDETAVMSMLIGAVRDKEMFKTLCRNPPEDLSTLKVDFLSIAMEVDRDKLKESGKYAAFKADGDANDDIANYVDRIVHAVRKAGYGNRSRTSSPSCFRNDSCRNDRRSFNASRKPYSGAVRGADGAKSNFVGTLKFAFMFGGRMYDVSAMNL